MDANLRRVAVLIASLDRTAVDAILGGLPSAEARRVRRAVIELGEYAESEQEQVIEEFLASVNTPRNAFMEDGGVELVLSDTRSHGPGRGLAAHTAAPSGPDQDAYSFLDDADVDVLGELIASEHPQVIALIVARLDADRAAVLLAKLQREMRESVLRRLIDIQEVDKSLAGDLLEQVRQRLQERESLVQRRALGLGRVSRILEAARARNERAAGITEQQPADYARRGPARQNPDAGSTWTIEDLERADDSTLATILGEAGPEILEMALLGVPSGIVRRIMRHLPAREARVLRGRIAEPGPTSLRDMDQARHMVLRTAARLEAEGRIPPRRVGRLSLAV